MLLSDPVNLVNPVWHDLVLLLRVLRALRGGLRSVLSALPHRHMATHPRPHGALRLPRLKSPAVHDDMTVSLSERPASGRAALRTPRALQEPPQ